MKWEVLCVSDFQHIPDPAIGGRWCRYCRPQHCPTSVIPTNQCNQCDHACKVLVRQSTAVSMPKRINTSRIPPSHPCRRRDSILGPCTTDVAASRLPVQLQAAPPSAPPLGPLRWMPGGDAYAAVSRAGLLTEQWMAAEVKALRGGLPAGRRAEAQQLPRDVQAREWEASGGERHRRAQAAVASLVRCMHSRASVIPNVLHAPPI